MARNTEMVRQWEILRDSMARGRGSQSRTSRRCAVHQRTIRRDIQALCDAGFALYDDKVNGTSMWKLRSKPFRALEETGLSVTELCALYFSRSVLGALTGAPFMDDVERAIGKVERALPAASRKYLDRLSSIAKAKSTGRKKQDERRVREIAARAMDACLTHRRVDMRYDSASSRRTKNYVVEPLRLSYADGGVYLTAYVPEYEEPRTFALERIETLAVRDEHFAPRPLPPEPFANSLGVNSGSPELIEIEFHASAAEYVAGREWHRSQEVIRRDDGSILLRLCVCDDRPLRSWILSFGAQGRVVVPSRLAREIGEELEHARDTYAPRFAMLKMKPIASRLAARA